MQGSTLFWDKQLNARINPVLRQTAERKDQHCSTSQTLGWLQDQCNSKITSWLMGLWRFWDKQLNIPQLSAMQHLPTFPPHILCTLLPWPCCLAALVSKLNKLGSNTMKWKLFLWCHCMVNHRQGTAWPSPSLSRLNKWPLSSLWNPSIHLALVFELWRYLPSDAVLTPAISPITGRLREGRSVLLLPVQIQRTHPLHVGGTACGDVGKKNHGEGEKTHLPSNI